MAFSRGRCPVCDQVKMLRDHHKLHPKARYRRNKNQRTVPVCKTCEIEYHAFHRENCEGKDCLLDIICDYIHICGFFRENLV